MDAVPQLRPNAGFTDFPADNSLAGWARENLTLTKDTVNFETGAYALNMAKAAGGASSWMRATIPAGPLRGQDVTFAARFRVPTGTTSNAGQLAIVSGNLVRFAVWGQCNQWFWRSITRRIPATANTFELRIYLNPTTDAAATPQVDRVSLTLGDFPTDLLVA